MAANGSGVNGRASKNHSALQVAETKSRDKINVAEHYYDLVRDSCEKLFNNDIEQSAFEDQMRHMFGIKVYPLDLGLHSKLTYLQEAYKIFTIDKLIGSIIKQVRDRGGKTCAYSHVCTGTNDLNGSKESRITWTIEEGASIWHAVYPRPDQ